MHERTDRPPAAVTTIQTHSSINEATDSTTHLPAISKAPAAGQNFKTTECKPNRLFRIQGRFDALDRSDARAVNPAGSTRQCR